MNAYFNRIGTLILIVACSSCAMAGKDGRKGPPSFSSLDLDSNGAVDINEFSQHEIPRGDHETVFGRIDENSDGIISESELTSHKPPRHDRQQKEQNTEA